MRGARGQLCGGFSESREMIRLRVGAREYSIAACGATGLERPIRQGWPSPEVFTTCGRWSLVSPVVRA